MNENINSCYCGTPVHRGHTMFGWLFGLVFSLVAWNGPSLAQTCPATPGSSGPGSPVGIVNSFYPGIATATAGSTSVIVAGIDARGSLTAIAAGDLVLIMQMQDASINTSNSSSYGGTTPGQGYTSLNSAGAYEYAAVVSFSGGVITVASGLINTYRSASANSSSGQKTFQVVRIPQYSSATLAGQITAPAWNGSTGGIVGFDVAGILNWAGRTVEVSGRGFRGGGGQQSRSNGTGQILAPTDYVSAVGTGTINLAGVGSVPNASKGEGIAGTPRLLFAPTTVNDNSAGTIADTCGGTDGVSCGYPAGSFARGAPGNAGGGGSDGNPPANDQNTGGGGGGSYGTGGTGGFGWTPGIPPGSPTGGFGGGGVPSSPSRLFMGGGGGAGVTNDGTGTPGVGAASSGAAGGGIVLIRAGSTTGIGTINANGTNANSTILNDASGGGGVVAKPSFLSTIREARQGQRSTQMAATAEAIQATGNRMDLEAGAAAVS